MATKFVKKVKLSKAILNKREMSLVNDIVKTTGRIIFTRGELIEIHGTLRNKKASPFFITKNMRCSVKGTHLYTLEAFFQENKNDLLDTTLLDAIHKREAKAANRKPPPDEPEDQEGPGAGTRLEDAYYRESPARKKLIIPRHNKLSNDFRNWLEEEYKVIASQERHRVDIRFASKGQAILAELKICLGVGTTRSIREAIGQLLEYNHYPRRKVADTWLIVLDEEPSELDKQYILTLRSERSMPISVGWRTSNGFSFHPKWPL